MISMLCTHCVSKVVQAHNKNVLKFLKKLPITYCGGYKNIYNYKIYNIFIY